jgi:catechol 2,3-dioxygenase-like lactoylglutathione lyase family enzyme
VKQSVSFVTLGVTDLERARRFYRDGLGWEPLMDVPSVVFFQVAPGVVLGMWGIDDLGEDAGRALTPGAAMALACNVDSEQEVRDAVDRWVAAGGTVTKEPPPQPIYDGFAAYVADPEGFLWEIAWNPSWRVGDDGSVTLS